MKKLILALIILSGCGMSSREMINDCMAEVTPISAVSLIGNPDLKDVCYSKYKDCLTDCYLDKESCAKAHEETISICAAYKGSLSK